jgi:large subunit ribosomal protein L34
LAVLISGFYVRWRTGILEDYRFVLGGVSVKRTYQPHNTRRKRKMGFLVRSASPSGRGILRDRRRKGRKRLAV